MAVHSGTAAGTDDEITHMVMAFGQFLDHDITETPTDESPIQKDCCSDMHRNDPNCFPIDVTGDAFYDGGFGKTCHPFFRSRSHANNPNSIREQFNEVTAFVDGSNVYGSTEEIRDQLREKRDGLMRLSRDGLLPTRSSLGLSSGQCGQFSTDPLGGDIRAGEQPLLSSMHLLFVLEHNRIAVSYTHLTLPTKA